MEVGEENLRDFVAGSVPTVYYVPDFITDSEQDQILTNIYRAPVSKWKSLKNRRLQNWGGAVHEKGLIAQDLPAWLTRITQRISDESRFPSAINHVLINEYLPNQGIMPHQDGPAYFPVVAIVSLGSPVVMDFSPHSGLTLCTNTFRNNIEDKVSDRGAQEAENDTLLENHYPFSVALMPRSLLIFKDKAYSDYLHGIKDCPVQRYDGAVNVSETREHLGVSQTLPGSEDSNSIHRTTNRISLTCRVVSKVHKNLFKF